MASSAENHHHRLSLPTPGGATAAPPPTPSTQPILSSETTATDFLSHLLRRLPPNLSFSAPIRRPSPLSAAVDPPLISLSDPSPSSLLSAATQFGYFLLADRRIPADLPAAAESAAASLFGLPHQRKQLLFPQNFPLGHEAEGDDGSGAAESFCLDGSTPAADLDFDSGSLSEFSREMERLGLEVLEKLACAAGFEKPAQSELCSLMWISDGVNKPGRFYPYAVGVHYQIRSQKMSLCSDSGWVTVPGRADSAFVTIGDIAQVWSNGKLKKVGGRPIPSASGNNKTSRCITMSLLVTLPMESTISPLVPVLVSDDESGECDSPNSSNRAQRQFNSFSFEDYAWRVYHEPMHVKDPLNKYRV